MMQDRIGTPCYQTGHRLLDCGKKCPNGIILARGNDFDRAVTEISHPASDAITLGDRTGTVTESDPLDRAGIHNASLPHACLLAVAFAW